jgi:integrase
LNFVGYVNKLKNKGEKRLFPELVHERDGYGRKISRWFNNTYKKNCGITNDGERKKDFHSFRTTFITRLAYKHVPEKPLKQVVGHSRGSDVTTKNYEEKFPVKQLYDEIISKVDYGIDLSHLKKNKYVISKK